MKVSIIIPVYNKIEIIGECIAYNIAHSKLKNQWIIIDNASEMPTKEGLKDLKIKIEDKGDECILITENNNTGVAKAWNKGLNYASGEYICILNNDCVMMPNWDSLLIENLKMHSAKLISPLVCEPYMFKKEEFTLNEFINGKRDWQFLLKKNKSLIKRGFFGGVVIFGNRSTFNSIGEFDDFYWLSMEEMDYIQRGKQKGLEAAVYGNVVAFHYKGHTRKEVDFNHQQNHKHFEKKFGWNFEVYENKFYNRWIKKYIKRVWKSTYKMPSINLIFPK